MQKTTGRFKKSIALLGAAMLVGSGLTLTSTAAHANGVPDTLAVCKTCDYTSIQAAVDGAESGDAISVAAGDYAESITIDKSLTLVGPSGQSPNSGDPLTAADRGEEAIILPPVGAANHGFKLTADATTVTISGFTVDLEGGAENQRYINAGTGERNLTVSQNVFTDGNVASNGSLVIDGQLGSTNLTFTDNRIQHGGASNGLRVHNSSPASTTTVAVTDNVWLDNKGLAMNLSSSTGETTGVISGNWIGNTDPGTSGEDNFAKRQGGMVLANAFAHLQVTDNTLWQTEDAAVSFWSGFSGTVEISDNLISGYSNVPNFAAIYVRPSEGDRVSNLEGVSLTENSFENPTEGSRAVLNQPDTGTLNAVRNWWGSPVPNFDDLVVGGNVSTKPYYLNPERTELSTKETAVSLRAPRAMVAGSNESVIVEVSPADAVGTLEIFNGDTRLVSGDASDGPVTASLAGLGKGSYTLRAEFTPADDRDFKGSSTEAALEVNVKNTTPAAPPADSSEALDELIERNDLDVPGTTAGFVPATDEPNSDLSDLDPSEPLVGELPWPFEEDSFVDVYSYSSPIFQGSFPVVDGKVQLSADISGLAPGAHRLLFIGQTSQGVQVMEITVQGASGASVPVVSGGGQDLAQTGAESFAPIGIGALGLLLGIGLIATGVIRNRSRRSAQ